LKTETIIDDLDPYFDEDKEFVECAENGKLTSCDIIEGFKSLCFVDTALHSAKLDGAKLLVDTLY
jgi:hypothetical protein